MRKPTVDESTSARMCFSSWTANHGGLKNLILKLPHSLELVRAKSHAAVKPTLTLRLSFEDYTLDALSNFSKKRLQQNLQPSFTTKPPALILAVTPHLHTSNPPLNPQIWILTAEERDMAT